VVRDALEPLRTIPTSLADCLVDTGKASRIARCKLIAGRGQELLPFFLLFNMHFTPFSLIFLVVIANPGELLYLALA
jgi:hypothetical protein